MTKYWCHLVGSDSLIIHFAGPGFGWWRMNTGSPLKVQQMTSDLINDYSLRSAPNISVCLEHIRHHAKKRTDVDSKFCRAILTLYTENSGGFQHVHVRSIWYEIWLPSTTEVPGPRSVFGRSFRTDVPRSAPSYKHKHECCAITRTKIEVGLGFGAAQRSQCKCTLTILIE